MGLNNNPSQPAYLIPGLPSAMGASITIGTDANGNLAAIPTVTVAGIAGQIQYNGGSNLAASSNLFWDNTNVRLGVGTSTPAFALDVSRSVASGMVCLQVENTSGTDPVANLRLTVLGRYIDFNVNRTLGVFTMGSNAIGDWFTNFNNTIIRANSGVEFMRINSSGNIILPAGATTMTNGFFYMPSAAGAPTGVPTASNGVPFYYDTTNNNFYVYNGAWKKVLLS